MAINQNNVYIVNVYFNDRPTTAYVASFRNGWYYFNDDQYYRFSDSEGPQCYSNALGWYKFTPITALVPYSFDAESVVSQLGSLGASVGALEGIIIGSGGSGGLKEDIGDIKAEIDSLNRKVNSLESRVEALENG